MRGRATDFIAAFRGGVAGASVVMTVAFAPLNGRAQAPPPKTKIEAPALTAPVVDQAGLLSDRLVQKLNSSLRSFRADGGAQIQVLTLASLEGLPIEQASIQVVEQWKLGGSVKDDGVLLLVAKAERRARIEVGQGLEGNLPDVIAKRIVSDVIAPRFKSGDFDGGIRSGVAQIARFANPELDISKYFEGRGNRLAPPRDRDAPWPAQRLMIILFVILIVFLFIGGGRGRRFRGGGWGAGGLGGLGGGLGGFGGGGFGGGGSGWSGGGGGFSGGGASGDW